MPNRQHDCLFSLNISNSWLVKIYGITATFGLIAKVLMADGTFVLSSEAVLIKRVIYLFPTLSFESLYCLHYNWV